MTRLPRPLAFGLALLALAVGSGCAARAPGSSAAASEGSASPAASSGVAGPSPSASGVASACDDAGFLAVVARHPSGYTEVTVCGPVSRVLPARRTRSGEHGYFYVTVAPGREIEIVNNLDEMSPFTVAVGDRAQVRGRYYDDPDGTMGIDWTHHSEPTASWPQAGYVIINGGPPAS